MTARASPRPCLLIALFGIVAATFTPTPADAAQSRKKSIWGPTEVAGVSQFPIYRDLGVGILQLPLYWHEVAPTRPARAGDPADPAYRWPAEVDYALREGRRHGIRVSPSGSAGRRSPTAALR